MNVGKCTKKSVKEINVYLSDLQFMCFFKINTYDIYKYLAFHSTLNSTSRDSFSGSNVDH